MLLFSVETQPKSIKELENITGRTANNLLRILRMLENYGFVRFKEGKGALVDEHRLFQRWWFIVLLRLNWILPVRDE